MRLANLVQFVSTFTAQPSHTDLVLYCTLYSVHIFEIRVTAHSCRSLVPSAVGIVAAMHVPAVGGSRETACAGPGLGLWYCLESEVVSIRHGDCQAVALSTHTNEHTRASGR